MNVSDLPPNMQAKIRTDTNGCWVWTGSISNRGYGQVGVEGKVRSTHRVAYEQLVGPIPAELQIDHLCRNKACCNPAHLEPVTARENTQRRPDVNKSHCIHGHELTELNLIVKVRPDGSEMRNCRECQRAAQRRAYERKKADQAA
jgi:hypothetical protein